jgi:hypothetical protein
VRNNETQAGIVKVEPYSNTTLVSGHSPESSLLKLHHEVSDLTDALQSKESKPPRTLIFAVCTRLIFATMSAFTNMMMQVPTSCPEVIWTYLTGREDKTLPKYSSHWVRFDVSVATTWEAVSSTSS